jgi:hypothetical protein
MSILSEWDIEEAVAVELESDTEDSFEELEFYRRWGHTQKKHKEFYSWSHALGYKTSLLSYNLNFMYYIFLCFIPMRENRAYIVTQSYKYNIR